MFSSEGSRRTKADALQRVDQLADELEVLVARLGDVSTQLTEELRNGDGSPYP